MLIESLQVLREQTINDFCSAMEFKSYTQLGYQFASDFAAKMPQQTTITIGYSEFAHSLGLQDKTVPPNELAGYLTGAYDKHFLQLIVQHQVAVFESMFFDTLRTVLIAQPIRLPSKRQVEYGVIVSAADKDQIISMLVDRELNELKYKPVADWFAYVTKLVSDICISDQDLGQIAEAKATRDFLVHNAGVVNETYRQKAGAFSRGNLGERISVAGNYTRDTWQLLARVLVTVIDGFLEAFETKKDTQPGGQPDTAP